MNLFRWGENYHLKHLLRLIRLIRRYKETLDTTEQVATSAAGSVIVTEQENGATISIRYICNRIRTCSKTGE